MRLLKYINEITMTSDTKVEVTSTSYPYEVKITIGEEPDTTEFDFVAEEWESGDNKNTYWEIGFYDEDGSIDIEPKSNSIALKLFAALTIAFKKFLQSKKPKDFLFQAKSTEAKRIKLYDTIAKKIAKNMKGYKFSRYKESTFGKEVYITYRFVK